ncbi:cobalt-precorrin-6A reductase [Actinoplanes sp. NPDC024001]|uniref:cobalt-precorrin-6A reductase n=1 Tax=Actinoplanes sp. NPDC024001 TaxID=3154598 RepID=UPI0033CDE036
MTKRILLLGGTTEARRLAGLLVADGHRVTTSLAGRTSEPLRPAGDVRIGGFGGVDGLVAHLRDERIDVLIDATHPFAATITRNAVAASGASGVPLLILRRPGWTARPGDEWHRVASLAEAAARVAELGRRVFLTTGRQELGAFADVDCFVLARSVEPPGTPAPRDLTVVLDRGPFTVESERQLMLDHRIDLLVTKDSGGSDAKLAAARALAIPVLMVDRPALPAGPVSSTPEEILAALRRLS